MRGTTRRGPRVDATRPGATADEGTVDMHSVPQTEAERHAEIACRLEAIARNAYAGRIGLMTADDAMCSCQRLAEQALAFLYGEETA